MSDYATILSAYHAALLYIEELEALVPLASRSKLTRPEEIAPPKAEAAPAAAHPEGTHPPKAPEPMHPTAAPATHTPTAPAPAKK